MYDSFTIDYAWCYYLAWIAVGFTLTSGVFSIICFIQQTDQNSTRDKKAADKIKENGYDNKGCTSMPSNKDAGSRGDQGTGPPTKIVKILSN